MMIIVFKRGELVIPLFMIEKERDGICTQECQAKRRLD